jgi:TDG/mug DNA glycosylase family protein
MGHYQPDILAPHLDVVFCGLNPATSAVAHGHNFSHGSNRFWAVLQMAGFTDERLRPEDERDLLRYRCGITAAVQRPTAQAAEVSAAEFRRARSELEGKLRQYAPRVIAFLGKRAYSLMTKQSEVGFGPQLQPFAGTRAWIVPNPSGRNRHFTLDQLAAAYRSLHSALRRC